MARKSFAFEDDDDDDMRSLQHFISSCKNKNNHKCGISKAQTVMKRLLLYAKAADRRPAHIFYSITRLINLFYTKFCFVTPQYN